MSETSNGKILYIGTFKMPDKCAASHRVKSVAKSFRELGYEVVFFGAGEINENTTPGNVEGFTYYNVFDGKKGSQKKVLFDVSHIENFLAQNDDVKAVVCYNYPSVALNKIRKMCKKKKIAVIADATEWFDGKGKKFPSGLIQAMDSFYRMKIVHKKLDGIICISSYLCKYYEKHTKVVRIPATVDINCGKYDSEPKAEETEAVTFIYSGSPAKVKEELGRVVDAFNNLQDVNVLLRVVGVTRERYMSIYDNVPNEKNIKFYGFVDHKTSLSLVKSSDYAVIVRQPTRVTNSGFPTKFAEAISCGVPVLATDTSDLKLYLKDGKNGKIIKIDQLENEIRNIVSNDIKFEVQRDLFDYRVYTEQLKLFIKGLGVEV